MWQCGAPLPITGIGRAPGNEEGRLEESRLCGERLVVDDTRLWVHAVGERLEVDGRGRHGLAAVVGLGEGVKPVGQVAACGYVEVGWGAMGCDGVWCTR